MRVSDYIARFLTHKGVPCVFGMAGGMITYLLDSCHRLGYPEIICVRHEQAAAFAAEAFGRITGVPGVATATSGPGATNLLTGIGSCYFDSSPAVFITGQVNANELKRARPIRQLGFQETDIVSVAKPLTKAAWLIEDPDSVPESLERAFRIATECRRGPVLLDIPMNVQRSDVSPPEFSDSTEACGDDGGDLETILSELFEQVMSARRPLVLVGGGVSSGMAITQFREFARRLRVPVVNSLMGVDALPCGDPLRVGLIGTYGNRWANLALGRSDLLLVIGSRLDIRQTGADVEFFRNGRRIYHVDCDPGEINNRVVGCAAIVADARRFLDASVKRMESVEFPDRADWLSEIETLRRAHPDTSEISGIQGMNPNGLMHEISKASNLAGAYTVDVGQHQMWAAQSLELGPDQRFLTSGGMGSMGFALPAAIGAALGLKGRPVVAIAGDGGFQCNVQELQTIAHCRIPVKMIVMNNGCLGMVRQFQESYFERRYQSTVVGYSAPDFSRVASAYDIEARSIETEAEVEDALQWLWSAPDVPSLLQVAVDPRANAYPKTAFGQPINKMEP